MTGPDDTDNHNFTREDVDTLLGVVEPDPADTSAVDLAQANAEVLATIARTTDDVNDVLTRLENDPSVPADLRERVRFACMRAWNGGWASRGHDRRTGITPNPFETSPAGEHPTVS